MAVIVAVLLFILSQGIDIFVMCVIMLCALLSIVLHEVTKTSDAN